MRTVILLLTLLMNFSALGNIQSKGENPDIYNINAKIYLLSLKNDKNLIKSERPVLLKEIQELQKKTNGGIVYDQLEDAKIRLNIISNKYNEALRAISKISDIIEENNEKEAEKINRILDFSKWFYGSAQNKIANEYKEQAFNILTSRTFPKNLIYAILKRAYLRGQFQFVLDVLSKLNMKNVNTQEDFDLLSIQAKTSEALYKQKSLEVSQRLDWPTEDEAKDLRRLARQCTAHYEKAVSSTKSKFKKLQLASEWWDLQTNMKYDADSEKLRDVLILDGFVNCITPSNDSGNTRDEKYKDIANFIQSFQEALIKGLDENPITKSLTQESKIQTVQTCCELIKQFDLVNIPDNVCSTLIRDVSTYWELCFPGPDISNKVLTDSFGWYLWGAIIGQIPDHYESEIICLQMNVYALIIEQYDKKFYNKEIKPFGGDGATKFLDFYKRFKDNRFIPYYKKAYLPFQFNYGIKQLLKKLEELKFGEHEDYYEKSLKSEKEKKDYKELLEIAHYHTLFDCVVSLDAPIYYHQLPGFIIKNCRGTYKNMLYIFTIGKAPEKAPEFEWKKFLSQKEYEQSKENKN